MKIKTVQNKVNALMKLNLSDLDFEGVTEDGQHTNIDADIQDIRKSLSRFSRQLKEQERKYVDHKFDHQLKSTFGKLTDYYNGDVNRALSAMDFAVNNMTKEPIKKLTDSDSNKNAASVSSQVAKQSIDTKPSTPKQTVDTKLSTAEQLPDSASEVADKADVLSKKTD